LFPRGVDQTYWHQSYTNIITNGLKEIHSNQVGTILITHIFDYLADIDIHRPRINSATYIMGSSSLLSLFHRHYPQVP